MSSAKRMEDPQPARPQVLVIDDEESMRHALRRGLERAGWACTVASTGKEGVDAFVAGRFDAVLTDMKLPDLSGLDIVAILTEMDAAVPVVVMTGYGTMQTALDAMRRGARDFVQKPFEVDKVVQVIARTIEERRLSRENHRLRALVERKLAPDQFAAVEAELAAARQTEEPAVDASRVGYAQVAISLDGELVDLREAQRRFETTYVEHLLARTGGNVAAAARIAGISRPNFHKKLRGLGVDSHRFKRAARRGRTHDAS